MEFDCFSVHLPGMAKRGEKEGAALNQERKNLLAAMKAAGEDLAPLSKRIGRNHAYLGQYVWRTIPRRLEEEDRKKLAEILEIDEALLKPGAIPLGENAAAGNTQRAIVDEKVSGLQFSPGAQSIEAWPKTLKIRGHVKAGVEGFFLDQGDHHGMAYRPPALIGVKDAFAVYVNDTSMIPAFRPGRIVWVHPSRPVFPDDDVVVELLDGQSFIKTLVRRTEKHVTCAQWNPKSEVKYDTKKVKRLYFVVGSYRED